MLYCTLHVFGTFQKAPLHSYLNIELPDALTLDRMFSSSHDFDLIGKPFPLDVNAFYF